MDVPPNDCDDFAGFVPGDLLLTSLAGCCGIDVVNILMRQRQQVTGFRIKIKGMQAPDPPWIWEDGELEYILSGKDLRPKLVERAIALSEDKYCSVAATIAGRTNVGAPSRLLNTGRRSSR